MKLEDLKNRLATSKSQLEQLKSELDRKDKLLRAGRDVNGDGTFDEKDKDEVEKVRASHDTAKKDVDDLTKQIEEFEANVETMPTQHIIFDDVLVETQNHRKLFSADKNGFKTQIGQWQLDIKDEVNFLVDSMVADSEEGPTLSGKDVLTVATSALSPIPGPLKTGIGVATMITDLIEKHYRSLLPATPTMREMEKQWRVAVDKLDDNKAGEMYDELVKMFREENWMEPDEEYIYHCFIKDWDALIDAFRTGKGLPSKESVKKEFMTVCLQNMEDDWMDWGSDVGAVSVTMAFDMDKNDFSFVRGEIDDLSSEVKKGLKTNPEVFGGNKIIMIPAPITVKIVGSGTTDGTYCEAHRNSTDSGSTSFKHIPMPIGADATLAEQATMFKIFTQRKVYDKVKITDIL